MNRKPSGKGKEKDQSNQANSVNTVPDGNFNNSSNPSNQTPINSNMFVPPPPGYMIPPGYIHPYYQWYLYLIYCLLLII